MLTPVSHTDHRLNSCIRYQTNSTSDSFSDNPRSKQREGGKRVAFTKEGMTLKDDNILTGSHG